MAKIAGRKNEGAWQRFNNWLANDCSPTEAAGLLTALENQTNVDIGFAMIVNTYTGYGIPLPDEMETITGWLSHLVSDGFPLDIYMGKVSYDFYEEHQDGDKITYKPIMGPAVAKMGIDIRAIAKLYVFSDRQLTWFAKDSHPTPVARVKLKKGSPERAEWVRARRAEILRLVEERKALGIKPATPAPKKSSKKVLTA